MSNSPQQAKPNLDKTDPKVQFKSKDIGSWASKQENPFAKQNRERQAKKQERDEKRQKVAPFFVVFASAAVIGVALWGLVMLVVGLINQPGPDVPMIAGDTNEDISNYKDILKNFYNQRPDGTVDEKIEDVEKAVQETLDTKQGKEYEKSVRIAQAQLYADNGLYDRVISTVGDLDTEGMTLDQLHTYYNMMYIAYSETGNVEKTQEYFVLTYDIGEQLQGANGG